MSDYLSGLLLRSLGPLPAAMRPLRRTRFEPERGVTAVPATPHAEEVEPRGESASAVMAPAPGIDTAGGETAPAARRRGEPPARGSGRGGPPAEGAASAEPHPARVVVEPQRTIQRSASVAAAGERATPLGGLTPAVGNGSVGGASEMRAPSAVQALEAGGESPPRAPATVRPTVRIPREVGVVPTPTSSGMSDSAAPTAGPELSRPIATPVEAHRLDPARNAAPPQDATHGALQLGRLRRQGEGVEGGPPRGESSGAAPEHAPVVRISIGRVEVRAATPPVRPAPPPARPRPPTLALGDYLAQRSEGRR